MGKAPNVDEMSDRPTLLDLLPPELKSGLTPAERKVLAAAEKGDPAPFQVGNEKVDDPANADKWDETRTLRAKFLYWLCTSPEATRLVHGKGVTVVGARVKGTLDFEAATIAHPLGLWDCALPEGMILLHARTRILSLDGSHVGSIVGDGLTTEGDLFLRDITATGEVRLLGADIGGDLDCDGATFDNKGGPALNADGLIIRGSLILRKTMAKGEIRTPGANVGGVVDCTGATFDNTGGIALNTDRLMAKGSVFLKEIAAMGEVRLLDANITGTLECTGATFDNTGGKAFSADRLKIEGTVFLKNITAKGEVRLPSANITSNLECTGATFKNPDGDALNAERLLIGGNLFLADANMAAGRLNLRHARTAILMDDKNSWPSPGQLRIEGFEYDSLAPDDTPKTAADRLKWLALQPQKPFKPQPYEQLAKVFRRMGQDEDARKVLIAKQKALRKHGKIGFWRCLWSLIIGATIAHGYRPAQSLLYIVPIILIGWGLFSWADTQGVMQPAKAIVRTDTAATGSPASPSSGPQFHAFMYSVDVFLPIVDFHQESHWFPDVTKAGGKSFLGCPVGYWIRWWLWAEIALGWVLSTLLGAALAGLPRKLRGE